ncbi:hypothetical protein [Deinococcus sp. DB0503]|uniref:hypothetical protein n=1 Tax=Deinococcus sp. DB0503 TaxID=2479203 RepID=UPI0018DF4844|nr:hypothetical protein [Deinococcus sp. DB0503]
MPDVALALELLQPGGEGGPGLGRARRGEWGCLRRTQRHREDRVVQGAFQSPIARGSH